MELHGFTDLDISLASERAASLRTEGDGLKHAIAEMRGLPVGRTLPGKGESHRLLFLGCNIAACEIHPSRLQ
jgi:hypothetical protein